MSAGFTYKAKLKDHRLLSMLRSLFTYGAKLEGFAFFVSLEEILVLAVWNQHKLQVSRFLVGCTCETSKAYWGGAVALGSAWRCVNPCAGLADGVRAKPVFHTSVLVSRTSSAKPDNYWVYINGASKKDQPVRAADTKFVNEINRIIECNKRSQYKK